MGNNRKWIVLLLVLSLLMSCAVAEMRQDVQAAYIATGDYLASMGTPQPGSVGGEWLVIGLARSGREVPSAYIDNASAYIREASDENDRLHRVKSTDNSRMILALTAIGEDVTDIAGHNLIHALNDINFLMMQGSNGPIWALIALNCGGYEVPADGNYSREMLVQKVLDLQFADGGWAISGDTADSDMTGMALQSLAPYYIREGEVQSFDIDVNPAVDAALNCLAAMQFDDGSYGTFDGNGNITSTCESTAQVLTALCALGIDPEADARFIKNGNTVVSGLMNYYVEGGGFRHLYDCEMDGMATEQAYYALTAFDRFCKGETTLYDMRDKINMEAR